VAVLVGIGLVLALAASPTASTADAPFHYALRQAGFVAVAGVVLAVCAAMDAPTVRRVCLGLFLVLFLMLAAILVVGHEAKGGQRWIDIGQFRFQPSEFIKPVVIVCAGWLLGQRELHPRGPWAPAAFTFVALTGGLLLLQPDVGQTALLGLAFVATFFVVGLPLGWAVGFAVGAGLLGVILYNLLSHVRYRVDSFLAPDDYERHQIGLARQAFESGGLAGAGPGEGEIKDRLPEAHTDFIYSVAAEEFGAIACVLIIALFAFVSLRGLWLASRQADPYRRAAAAGLFALFGLQALINLLVNTDLMPPKGMTLPLISYGGSSLIGTAMCLGFALALTRAEPTTPSSQRREAP
jgi:cell division protein FtsW